MKTRILVIKKGCPFCRQMLKVINRINLRLLIDKKIQIVDSWEYEDYDLDDIPLLSKLEKDGLKEGYPFCYIDGIRIEPAPTPEQMKILLETFLKEDFII